ncbi:structural protein [Rhodanobacter hydrolyticus]|uniref:hypothetical protein n=1 Tax=Rhodanobacter hydrolyticus TaxID=2250595 RepID=UPI0038503EA7
MPAEGLYPDELRYGQFRPEWVEANNALTIAITQELPRVDLVTGIAWGAPYPRAIAWATKFGAALVLVAPDGTPLDHEQRRELRLLIRNALATPGMSDKPFPAAIQAFGYSERQAKTIAVTEESLANCYGSLCGAIDVGMKVKRWLVSNDPGICLGCTANHAQSWVPIDQPFASGAMVPADHVGCRCDAVHGLKPR